MTERQRPYTLADLAEAEARYADAKARVDNYDGNNPNRGRSDLRHASDHLTLVTLYLRAQGDLPKPEPTPKQRLEQALDAAFPQARSKDIVEYEGKRYQLRFAPARQSRSRKTVVEWSRWWQEV
jgi:hypothetical protein